MREAILDARGDSVQLLACRTDGLLGSDCSVDQTGKMLLVLAQGVNRCCSFRRSLIDGSAYFF